VLERNVQDRDLLTIEREFYNDFLQVLEPKKTQELPKEDQRKRAQYWAKEQKQKK
jgi:hypothetical protein